MVKLLFVAAVVAVVSAAGVQAGVADHAVHGARADTTATRVSAVAGRTSLTAPSVMSLHALPTVRSVVPAIGPAQGGTTVLVRGTGFVPGTKLLVGGHVARGVRVRNPDALVAVMPAGFGRLALRVVTPSGTSHATMSVSFSYRTTVLVIGDSLGIDLGWGFSPQLPGSQLLTAVDLAVGSTGIVRWDYYDWPAELRADLHQVHPQFVVALFGANDQQSIPTSKGPAAVGTPAWVRAYESRVRELAAIVAEAGAKIAWVGLPRMGPQADVAQAFVTIVDRTDSAAMQSNPKAAFVSTASLFTTPAGGYTDEVRMPNGGIEVGRQPDEVHVTPDGAVAIDVLVLRALAALG